MTLRDRLSPAPAALHLGALIIVAFVLLGWAWAFLGDTCNAASKASREALEW